MSVLLRGVKGNEQLVHKSEKEKPPREANINGIILMSFTISVMMSGKRKGLHL